MQPPVPLPLMTVSTYEGGRPSARACLRPRTKAASREERRCRNDGGEEEPATTSPSCHHPDLLPGKALMNLSDEFHTSGCGLLLLSPERIPLSSPPAGSSCSVVDDKGLLEHEVSSMYGVAIKYGVEVIGWTNLACSTMDATVEKQVAVALRS